MEDSMQTLAVNLAGIVPFLAMGFLFQTSMFNIFADSTAHEKYASGSNPLHKARDRQRRSPSGMISGIGYAQLSCLFKHLSFCLHLVYAMIVLKGIVQLIVHLEAMEQYHFLDCFIVGRFVFDSKTSTEAKFVGFCVVIAVFSYKLTLYYARPSLRLTWIDFLLARPDLVDSFQSYQFNDAEVGKLGRPSRPLKSVPFSSAVRRHELLESGRASQWGRRRLEAGHGAASASKTDKQQQSLRDIFLIKLPHCGNPKTDGRLLLRFNRTKWIWTTMTCFLCIYCLGCLWFVFSFVGLMMYIVLPTIVTRLGFELTFNTCIQFIENYYAQTNSTTFSHIHVPARLQPPRRYSRFDSHLPLILPWEDLCQGSYHRARIYFQVLEENFVLVDGMFTLASHSLIVAMIVSDVTVNYWHIRERLDKLVGQLKSLQHFKQIYQEHKQAHSQALAGCNTRQQQSDRLAHLVEPPNYANELVGDIVQVQTLLIDHFKLILHYNPYLQMHYAFCLFFWTIYTCVVSLWIGLTGGKTIEVHFYVIQSITTLSLALILMFAVRVRADARSLYPLISSAMALDDNHLATKLRWSIIVQYYYPMPLYCFTFFRSAEMSHMFILKLLAWICSAIVVMASFLFA